MKKKLLLIPILGLLVVGLLKLKNKMTGPEPEED